MSHTRPPRNDVHAERLRKQTGDPAHTKIKQAWTKHLNQARTKVSADPSTGTKQAQHASTDA